MKLLRALPVVVFCGISGCSAHTPLTQQSPNPVAAQTAEQRCIAKRISIDRAPSGETEEASVTVSGSVENACVDTWIVVHPAGSTTYYVQPRLTVGNDGRWLTSTRLGDAGQGAGQTYELVAFANPEGQLEEGKILAAWPSAQARSDVVLIKRKAATPPPSAVSSSPPTRPPSDCRLSIIEPTHEGMVGGRPDVVVQTASSCTLSSVWVVVHPTSVSTYWVQPRASERAGRWKAKIHIGREGRDWGATFEIKAFGDPNGALREGQELPFWPEAAVASELIEVKKGR